MSRTPPIPSLESLDQRPTWHNRAGRVDRSACFVLTASKLWRQIPDDSWAYARSKSKAVHRPIRIPARYRRPDRAASINLWAYDLWMRHKNQPPGPLAGDFRTAKSNALNTRDKIAAQWKDIADTINTSSLDLPTLNPNRGAGFSAGMKILGLPAEWETTLTLERYVQHEKLKQHFLVCPVCGDKPPASRSDAATPRASLLKPRASPLKPKALPAGRVTKLFLPLCTRTEWEDAQRAHLWLNTHTHPNRPLAPEAAELIQRYAELFPARQLRCRDCLGLRYGEVKKSATE